ncbi:hypothetical protein H6F90_12355 [Trichocoleus sp. FACHB-591]|uniref:hypothetical protein n=1 Tax=Trichocoleus sp. FACHB-591 TaxID=2692872 RepID=UPI0016876E88|nr:hypothetical protein [Trichocoleus sp. FACHB-591]MBD2095940.1 hypothetical protein [Trichocoleus sp. FACHB-591]
MKHAELKAQVYKLAEVSTVQQLKAKHESLKALDMRRKVSWQEALVLVKTHQDEFQNWLANPPDEYKELFSEIDSTSQEYNRKVAEANQIAAELITIASDLEELAKEHQGEADSLKREVRAARRTSKHAELN